MERVGPWRGSREDESKRKSGGLHLGQWPQVVVTSGRVRCAGLETNRGSGTHARYQEPDAVSVGNSV